MHYLIIIVLFFALKSATAQVFEQDSISSCGTDSILLRITPTHSEYNTTVEWRTPHSIVTNTDFIYATRPGKYYVSIINSNKKVQDSVTVLFNKITVSLVNDTVICKGNTLKLDLPNAKNTFYLWSTEETSSSIELESAGKYWLKTTQNNCTYTDTFLVTIQSPAIPNFGKEVSFCDTEDSKTISVKAPTGNKILWNTGATTPSIRPTKEGTYWVNIESKGCGKSTDSVSVKFKNCDCELYIPSSFTPNDDEKNDTFFPVSPCDLQYFNMTVFDRWGNTVYTSTNINSKWDGKFKGNLCPDDVYIYRIETIQKSTEKKGVRTGHISLFR